MTSPRPNGWTQLVSRDSQLAKWLAVLAILLVMPGIVGWLLGIPWLVQPLATFAPARVGGVLLILLAAGALLAKLADRRSLAIVLALACAAVSLSGIALAVRGITLPIETLARARLGPIDASAPDVLPLSVGLLYLMHSAALLLLLKRQPSEHTLVLVGGLAASQVALAGVLFLAQLSALLEGTDMQGLRAPLHSVLAAFVLGIAMLQRLSRREQEGVAPPRWVSVLAGVSAGLLVLILWQALKAREAAQLSARSEINAEAIDRAIQRQYGTVQKSLGRGAAYLSESRLVDDAVWRTGLPRMAEEIDGLQHILWFDSTGTLLRSASPAPLPPDVLAALSQHVRDARLSGRAVVAPHSTTLSTGVWPLALWVPVYSPFRAPTVLVGLVDEAQLIRPFIEDVARDVWVRVRAKDSTLLQMGSADQAAPRFTTPLTIGARTLTLEVAEQSDTPNSPLPDVVLALGLAVSILLATTLWLQRRIWLQAYEEGQRFRAVFDTAFQVQLLLDLDGTVLEANRAAGELADQTPEQLLGVSFWRARWWADEPQTGERVQERFERARSGDTQRFEVELSQGRDRSVTMDFSLKPLLDASQRVTRVIAEGRDLTIRKRAEESLREISALTTMGQLAARVAHEINNPLAGIQNAFLLVRGAIPEDHPHYRFVGAIEREIARIAAVTRQLYETYRPDHLMAKQSSVILAVSDAVSFLEQVNRGRQVHIVADMSKAPSLVPVPDALLRQTLYNLVQNAVDVSPAGGTVTVHAVQDGDSCVLRVSDEGPGIPPAIRERIFDPFFSTKDRTMKTGGMGIGLALVRQSVLAVGGQITVHDRPTGGTEFEVRLPMTPLDTGALR
jgi:PAS domain S-box-containing protein